MTLAGRTRVRMRIRRVEPRKIVDVLKDWKRRVCLGAWEKENSVGSGMCRVDKELGDV